MKELNWDETALRLEIEFSKALGSAPIEYPHFIHLYNRAVPWNGDFNRAVGVRLSGSQSFDEVVKQVEQIHQGKHLDRPNRYDIYPPPLDKELWHDYLSQKGYRLQMAVFFQAPTLDKELPSKFTLYSPPENEYMEWYHSRVKSRDYYEETWFGIGVVWDHLTTACSGRRCALASMYAR